MSIDTDALVGFGYDLGGDDNGWNVEEIDEDGALALPWYTPGDPTNPFGAQAERQLAAAAGLDPSCVYGPGVDFERLGVRLLTYQHANYPHYLLVSAHGKAPRGPAQVLPTKWLASPDTGRLDWALQALGLTPQDPEPAWYLASFTDFPED